ncbi:MAG: dihydrofolate reductase [Chromatiales bacterium]|jgi:dihydrofolate reductase
MNDARPVLSLVVAVAENGVIGRAGRLPWHLPADLRHFKTLTMGKPLLMGRRTWESLPGVLPGRRHIVLTRTPGYRAPGCAVVHSMVEALASAGDVAELMVIGGAGLFAETLPLARRIYLTRVHAAPQGDTFFPPFDPGQWREIERLHRPADEKNPYACTFTTLERSAGG